MRPTLCLNQTFSDTGLWGLGRISHRPVGPWDKYIYRTNFHFCPVAPERKDVTAYIIDTGIYYEHDEFEGRASLIFKAHTSWDDINHCGHGTHVAGTIAGKTYGVAKNAQVLALKVIELSNMGRSTEVSAIIEAIGYAYDHARSTNNTSRSVINISIGKFVSPPLPSPILLPPSQADERKKNRR
jgi:subtilisin family serine protease